MSTLTEQARKGFQLVRHNEGPSMSPAQTVWSIYGIGVAALFILLVAVRGDAHWTNTMVTTLLFAGLAVAWNIIGGFGGQLSLGHGVYFAVGAYTTGILYTKHDISPWFGLVAGIPIAIGVALLVSWPTFRLSGPFFAIATLALNQIALVLALYFSGLTGGPAGLTLPFEPSFGDAAFTDRSVYAFMMLAFVAAALAVSIVVYRSRLGFGLRSVREDQEAAAAAGFDVLRVKLTGMMASAALTSVGGALYAMYVRYLDPPSLLSLGDVSVRIVLIVLLGGMGTLAGPVIGALVLVPLIITVQSSVGGDIPGLNLALVGLMMILIPLVLRRGIVGTASHLLRVTSKGKST